MLKQPVTEMGQLWVNSQIPSFNPVNLWFTGKKCWVKSTQKEGNNEKRQETTSDKTPFNRHMGDLQMQEGEMTKDLSINTTPSAEGGWVGFSQAGKGDRQRLQL